MQSSIDSTMPTQTDSFDDDSIDDDTAEAFGDDSGLSVDTTPCPFCKADIYEDAECCPNCKNYVHRDFSNGRPRWIKLTALVLAILMSGAAGVLLWFGV